MTHGKLTDAQLCDTPDCRAHYDGVTITCTMRGCMYPNQKQVYERIHAQLQAPARPGVPHTYSITLPRLPETGFTPGVNHAQAIKPGDIYNWEFNEARITELRKYWGSEFLYHCRTQIAVAHPMTGQLYDTYWGITPYFDGARAPLNLKEINLLYRGSINTLVKIDDWQLPYYNPADIVDMRHGNDSQAPVYVQHGALRSATHITEFLLNERERAYAKITATESRVASINNALNRVAQGNLDGDFP